MYILVIFFSEDDGVSLRHAGGLFESATATADRKELGIGVERAPAA